MLIINREELDNDVISANLPALLNYYNVALDVEHTSEGLNYYNVSPDSEHTSEGLPALSNYHNLATEEK
eukprot:Awhi_evm1s2154